MDQNTPPLAFPAQFFDERATGMTLHDYFMAHAPAEPQKWFNPEVPPCPAVPSIRAVENAAWRADLELQSEWSEKEQSPEARKWFEAQLDATVAQAEWQDEFRKQRYVQWPAAWATLMMGQRKC